MTLPTLDHWSVGVLRFWFETMTEAQWWSSTPELDDQIRMRFLSATRNAASDDIVRLTQTPRISLAAVIALDQFPRNMFRRTAEAFETDAKARRVAETAIDKGHDTLLPVAERQFLYMPLMHAEDHAAQTRAVALFTALGLEGNLLAAVDHKVIFDRFGRFPHRNEVLGRKSTPEEETYLANAKRYGQ